MPNFRQAILRAFEKIGEMLPSAGKRGEALGSTVGPWAVTTTYKKLRRRHEEIELQHIQEIHAHHDTPGNVLEMNVNGRGIRVANVYQGGDGHFYKHTKNRWYCWIESRNDWEEVDG